MSHVFLIGFMGAGKSTVGQRVAVLVSLPFIDLDHAIVVEQGRSIAEIFAEQGEARFRELERDALASLADAPFAVVACGGGVVTTAESRSVLRELGTVVYLRTTVAETFARISDRSSRPLLVGPDAEHNAVALLEARSVLYEEIADIEIDTVGRSPAALAEEIAGLLDERKAVR